MSAKKYIIKDGNSSTSKDLILDATTVEIFLSCHQAATSLLLVWLVLSFSTWVPGNVLKSSSKKAGIQHAATQEGPWQLELEFRVVQGGEEWPSRLGSRPGRQYSSTLWRLGMPALCCSWNFVLTFDFPQISLLIAYCGLEALLKT